MGVFDDKVVGACRDSKALFSVTSKTTPTTRVTTQANLHFTQGTKAKIADAIAKGNIDDIAKVFKQEASWDIKDALNKVPEHVRKSGSKPADSLFDPTDPVPGIKFDAHPRDKVRIMKGNPNAPHSTQQQDYVKIVSNGKVGLRDGRFIDSSNYLKPSHHPESHIPLNEWIKWNKWNEK